VLSSTSSVVLGLLAGCFSDGKPDVLVANDRTESVTASITLTRLSDEATLLSETVSLDAEEEHRWEFDFEGVPHELRVTVGEGAQSRHEWTPGEEYCCIRAYIRNDTIDIRGIAY